MKIVTGATAGWGSYIRELESRAVALGYETIVFDLGGLGQGIPLPLEPGDLDPIAGRIPRSAHIPRLCLAGLDTAGEDICMMGADAFPVLSIDPEVDGWDLAVTVRSPGEIMVPRGHPKICSYINTGAMWFRNNDSARFWMREWDQQTKKRGDQWSANDLTGFRLGWGKDEWASCYDRIFSIDGVRVLFLDTRKWNYYHFSDKLAKLAGLNKKAPGPDVRIYHYKRSVRQFHPAGEV